MMLGMCSAKTDFVGSDFFIVILTGFFLFPKYKLPHSQGISAVLRISFALEFGLQQYTPESSGRFEKLPEMVVAFHSSLFLI